MFPYAYPSPAGETIPIFYIETLTDAVPATVFTFTNRPVGAADANRKIFVEVGVDNATITVSGITVGGVSAARLSEALISSRNGSIWIADVPTGTTATIIVTASGTSNNCLISTYRSSIALLGLLGVVTNTVGSGSVDTLSLDNVVVRPGGFALAFAGASTVTGTTETYTGIDPMVVDDERTSGLNRYSSCSVITTETSDTNDFTFTTATNSGFWLNGVSMFPLTGSAYAPNLASTFSDATDQSVFTFNAQGIGVANSARQLIIPFGWASTSSRTVTSVTVDGNAATQVVFEGSGTSSGLAIYRYVLATGTTANVVITLSGNATRLGGGVYDTRPRGAVTALDSGSKTVTSTVAAVDNVVVSKGGFLIVAGFQPATETMTASYNGTDTLVKDSQLTLEAISAVGLFSCLTTEYATSNDPGFSAATSNSKKVCAASWV